MKSRSYRAAAFAGLAISTAVAAAPAGKAPAEIRRVVDAAVLPLMQQYQIPGMAVGLVVQGQPRVLNYGVQSLQTGRPVAAGTLFEIGSLSKTFTATLATWAQAQNRLSLSDPIGKYLPELRGTEFGKVSLFHLGTHTAGGLPLQVPDQIRDEAGLMDYFKAWRPAYPAGTRRTYANPGIGTLGLVAARSLGQDFATLAEGRLFPALGMTHTYIDVPASGMASYAQGYTTVGKPIRLAPGVLWRQAYGVKTTAADMVRFMQANMGMLDLDPALRRAIAETHVAYFQAGPMMQDLIWEQYPYPVSLQALMAGNATALIFEPTAVAAIDPPQAPRADAWINKTGSTNGFGAYMAFVPRQRLGVVLLANKNFPIDARVRVAYDIITALSRRTP
ncbi:class C beta-lactamase [Bordetella sp. BOR01]|uniref:class C beta-lactamase n=1 Tax=Bordetella sp. BOR01 TaxID=2854779 RepID=UPI001C459567|nr:class C beta-lactamase [Bordetella sp. BOR01]MBV7483932.1 beta-lactamase [Bordetella sp. BOR01]